MSARKQSAEQLEAIERLREWLKPGDTVYTILRHVSRSGMQREISLKRFSTGNSDDVMDLDYSVAEALGDRIGKHDGVVVGGCGMDMGFDLVYSLSHVLFPDGFGCIGEGCASNDHGNGDRDYTPHGAIGGCRLDKEPCTCHDRSAWGSYITDRNGMRMLPYPNGCSYCGCHRVEHWHSDGGYALRQRWL